jgi:hypothetical protein
MTAMYYTSAEDARSDLFLSGAAYVFGPLLLSAVLRIVPLGRIPGVTPVFALVLPLAVTVLVPFLLIRYRKESLRDFGLGPVHGSFGLGLLLAIPMVVAGVLEVLVRGGTVGAGFPLLQLATRPDAEVVGRLLGWLGLTLLAVYGTVKARDAFSGTPVSVEEGMHRIGRILAIVVAVTGGLLLLSVLGRGRLPDTLAALILPVVGVAGTALLARRTLVRATTTLPTLVTPVVLMAVGPFALTFDPTRLVVGVYQAGLYAVIGLVIGVLQETRRSAWGTVALALALGLLTGFGAVNLGR